jgi:hypothetical protein
MTLSLCGLAAVLAVVHDEHRDHASITTARALEILRAGTDANLVGGAYAALSRDVEAAVALLLLRAADGDQQACDMLARWHRVTCPR